MVDERRPVRRISKGVGGLGLHFNCVVKFHVNRIKAVFQLNSKLSSKILQKIIWRFEKCSGPYAGFQKGGGGLHFNWVDRIKAIFQ